MKKYKIVNKKRFYLFVTFIFILTGIIIFNLIANNNAHSSILAEPYEEIIVIQGDTIWSIASKYTPIKYDIRDMVYNIKRINEIETSYIYPGDTLKIPIIE